MSLERSLEFLWADDDEAPAPACCWAEDDDASCCGCCFGDPWWKIALSLSIAREREATGDCVFGEDCYRGGSSMQRGLLLASQSCSHCWAMSCRPTCAALFDLGVSKPVEEGGSQSSGQTRWDGMGGRDWADEETP